MLNLKGSIGECSPRPLEGIDIINIGLYALQLYTSKWAAFFTSAHLVLSSIHSSLSGRVLPPFHIRSSRTPREETAIRALAVTLFFILIKTKCFYGLWILSTVETVDRRAVVLDLVEAPSEAASVALPTAVFAGVGSSSFLPPGISVVTDWRCNLGSTSAT